MANGSNSGNSITFLKKVKLLSLLICNVILRCRYCIRCMKIRILSYIICMFTKIKSLIIQIKFLFFIMHCLLSFFNFFFQIHSDTPSRTLFYGFHQDFLVSVCTCMFYCCVLFYICYIYLLEILNQLYTGLCNQSNVLIILHLTKLLVYKLE